MCWLISLSVLAIPCVDKYSEIMQKSRPDPLCTFKWIQIQMLYIYIHTHIFCSSQLIALEHGITCLEDLYKQVGSSACFSTCLCHSASALERLQDEKVAQMYYSILYYETYYILWSFFNPRDWNPEISWESLMFPKEKLWDFDIAKKNLKIVMQDCHRDSDGKHQKS